MPDKFESLLVADIGSVTTKVAFVDRVGSDYRFMGMGVSLTTADPPAANVMIGLRRAVQQIEERTQRRFLAEDGQLMTPERGSGQGVDAFAAVTSAALPLRVGIVGLSRGVSVASATCAVRSTYAIVQVTLALDETGGRWLPKNAPIVDGDKQASPVASARDPAVIAAELLARANLDVIVLVGGIDGGATSALYEMANLIGAIAASRDQAARPVVIFAGNREARPEIAARLGQIVSLRVVDNVHPALNRENPAALQRELESLYVERQIPRVPGLSNLTHWTSLPVLTSAHAFETVVRFLSRRYGLDVLGADIGGTTTAISRVHEDSIDRAVRSDVGVGCSLDGVLEQAGAEALVNALPIEASPSDVRAYCLDHRLRPACIPTTRAEARLQQAAAKQALASAAKDCSVGGRAVDLILLTGGVFAHNSDYGALALVALDALEPRGILTLAVDTLGLAPAMGALAALNTEAAASVIERDGFVTLGTVVAPVSTLREGQGELRVRVQPAGAGEMNVEVAHGSLELVPLAPGQKAALQVNASKGVDLGPGRRGLFKTEVEGGALGLVIDARGRPLGLPSNSDKRREKIQQWYWDVGS